MIPGSSIKRIALAGAVCGAFLAGICQGANQAALEVDSQGGRVLRLPGFDLRGPGVEWGAGGNPAADQGESGQAGKAELAFRRTPEGIGYYPIARSVTSAHTVPLLPNRSYVISVLLLADFDRNVGLRTAEVNLGLRTYDGGGKNCMDHLNGIPARTHGWQRWQWEFTTDPRAASGRFHGNVYGFPSEGKLWVADVALVELPPKPLKPYAPGQGVTFQGGPGNLPMRIEEVKQDGNGIVVRTTGAAYLFDRDAGTITAGQMIGRQRRVATWRSSLPLKDLKVLTQTVTECVLGNDNLTVGVQCDSLAMIAPHNDLILTCTSAIGGKWNRLACGHLFVVDEHGGMAANPDIPLGTGRLARLDANVRPGRVKAGQLDFGGRSDDQTFLSQAKPGWSVKWYIAPGERIAISTFPPRPYPWKDSFETYFITNSRVPVERYAEWSRHAKAAILWNWIRRGWGGSQGAKFEVNDEAEFRRHIEALKKAGIRPCPYLSPYFYILRDAFEFAHEAKRLRDQYGIEGAYYDGIPSQEWIVAYEQMRLTREVFKDGTIIYHNTGHASNGTAPLGEPSLKIPAIETYADFTYAGELVYGYGPDWPYPRYIASQYNLANCIGTLKSGEWAGVTPQQRDLLMLKYNGRACMLPQENEGSAGVSRLEQLKTYWPVLDQLRALWEAKGSEPDFYEKHYLPRFHELAKGLLPE